jgi:hypothetical protein
LGATHLARCCCHCTARSMSNPSSAYIETLRSFLCFDGVIGSTERWWSGKKGFDFLDSGQAADGQVKYLDSVSSAVYVNHAYVMCIVSSNGAKMWQSVWKNV